MSQERLALKVVFNRHFNRNDCEWIQEELNRLLNLELLRGWEFGEGDSAIQVFRPRKEKELYAKTIDEAKKIVGKTLYKKYKVTEIKETI